MDVRENTEEKGCLIVVSCVLGAGVGVLLFFVFLSMLAFAPRLAISITCGILSALLWPIAGAAVIWICESLDSWANLGNAKKWPDDKRLNAAAFWPITLLFSLIVFPFLGIIHRLF